MIPRDLLPLANHLWQSTLFAVIAGLLALLLKNNRAHTRYCLWLAASAKFLLPFSLLVLAASQIGRDRPIAPMHSSVPLIIQQVHEPFEPQASPARRPILPPPPSRSSLIPILGAVWAAGSAALAFSWWRRWRQIRAAFREASPVPLSGPFRNV